MGILNGNSNQITHEALIDRGFETDGWGSPYTRETRNTTMYELFIEDDLTTVWVVMYFPPEFEGTVCPSGRLMNMQGKVMMQHASGYDNKKYIINVADMNDIEVFIEQVLADKVEPYNYEHR